MKLIVTILTAGALAVGCSHRPDERDAKIAKLETRLTDLESRYDGLNSRFTNLLDIVKQENAENIEASSKLEAAMKEQNEHWNSLLRLFAGLTNTTARQVTASRYAPVQPQVSSYATKDGVPIAVYNQITAEAARRYPTDYDMQVFVIKEQTEAYRKLHQ
jgi:hypothetical protein